MARSLPSSLTRKSATVRPLTRRSVLLLTTKSTRTIPAPVLKVWGCLGCLRRTPPEAASAIRDGGRHGDAQEVRHA